MSIREIKSEMNRLFNSSFVVSEETEDSLNCSCRHWGDWELPEDADEDEEDYDYEVLTQGSNDKLVRTMTTLKADYPDFEFDDNFSEKNYIDFQIDRRII